MSLVTADEVANYLGQMELTDQQRGFLETVILPGVQQELEQYCGRPLEPQLVRESLVPDTEGYINFSVAPVWQIISLKHSSTGTAIPFTNYFPSPAPTDADIANRRVFDPAGLGQTAVPFRMRLGLSGQLGFFGQDYNSIMWGACSPESQYVVVEYIGGYYGTYDQQLKLAMLRVAARETELMFDDSMSLRDGAIQVGERSDQRNKGWQPEELKAFDRLRRRIVR
jgi:hypothetical protein